MVSRADLSQLSRAKCASPPNSRHFVMTIFVRLQWEYYTTEMTSKTGFFWPLAGEWGVFHAVAHADHTLWLTSGPMGQKGCGFTEFKCHLHPLLPKRKPSDHLWFLVSTSGARGGWVIRAGVGVGVDIYPHDSQVLRFHM